MKPDLVVVHSPVGGGHKAAALATAEAARRRGLEVVVLDAFEGAPRWATETYVGAHLTGQSAAPGLYGRMFFAANRRDPATDPLRLGLDVLLFGRLADRVRALAPRAVIATHHLPLVVLGRARRKGLLDAPVVGVVTDYIAHACWAERGVDAFAVPTRATAGELTRHLAGTGARLHVTGIPVRDAFERIAPLATTPRRDALRVLVTSGGFSVGPVARIVRSFRAVADVELTVVCGAREDLVARVRGEAARHGVPARVLGFERDMPARLAEADVVVGKAGGLTVTEAMTAGRPMGIAYAVPGNEAENERFVVRGGAGVSAFADDVGERLAELRAQGALAAMGARARALVPRGAASAVVDVALDLARATRAA